MSKQKPQRWYEIVGGTAYVYDRPYPGASTSVSVIPVEDLEYYRTRFDLTKVWTSWGVEYVQRHPDCVDD
jgi:outer membrane scaffolding protein for murein synthesis (MipA/OmpV family)